jgi:hypothetical protein
LDSIDKVPEELAIDEAKVARPNSVCVLVSGLWIEQGTDSDAQTEAVMET